MFIYLKTNPEVCFKRLQKRSRNEESSVPLDYLVQLHNKHETWLNNIEKSRILTIDANKEFETDLNRFNEIVSEINTFISKQ